MLLVKYKKGKCLDITTEVSFTIIFGEESTLKKTYGDGILGVTSAEFRKYALLATVESCNFPEVKDQTENRRLSVNIVPARFSTMRYINSPKYLENDEEYEDFKKEKIQEPRTANVKFVRLLQSIPAA